MTTVSTCRTLLDMPAECLGAAGNDGAPCLGLSARERMRSQIRSAMGAEDVGQLNQAASGHGSGRDGVDGGQQIER